MRQLLATRYPPESAAARVNNKNKRCGTLHESTHLPKLSDITREKQNAFQLDAVR